MDHMSTDETVVGICTGNFPRLRVAGIKPSSAFGKGDTVVFKPKDWSLREPLQVTIKSLEVDHSQVDRVQPGQLCGVEICCSRKQLPEEGDRVFILTTPENDPLDSQIVQKANYSHDGAP